MKNPKGTFVKEITGGSEVRGIFYVKSKKLLRTQRNDPYIALTLSDSSGEIPAKLWKEEAGIFGEAFEEGDFISVQGKGNEYRGETQVIISHIEKQDISAMDQHAFMPAADIDPDRYMEEIYRVIASIARPSLAGLLTEIFSDNAFAERFRHAPAAKKMHHAYVHGLLEHTVSVTRLAIMVCKHYDFLDRDMMLTGSICHDLGKTEEIGFSSPSVEYTDQGRLLGHITLGVNLVRRFAARIGIPDDDPDIVALEHMILSHHGELEFGSPVLPMTKEAMMLHMIDNMDARMNYMKRLKENTRGNWTEYQRPYGRFFYIS